MNARTWITVAVLALTVGLAALRVLRHDLSSSKTVEPFATSRTLEVADGQRVVDAHGLVRTNGGDSFAGPRVLIVGSELLAGVTNERDLGDLAGAGAGNWLHAAAEAGSDTFESRVRRAGRAVVRFEPALVVLVAHPDDDVVDFLQPLVDLSPRKRGSLLVAVVPKQGASSDSTQLTKELDMQRIAFARVELDADDYLPDGRLAAGGHNQVAIALRPRVRRILESL